MDRTADEETILRRTICKKYREEAIDKQLFGKYKIRNQ